MFPTPTATNENTLSVSESKGTKCFLFDFSQGDFVVQDGKLVECDGVDAIRVWIEKILRTEKGRVQIYDQTEYGCHLEDLIIGNSYTVEFIEAELKREIEDALLLNPQITSVTGFVITKTAHSVTVAMEVYINDTGPNSVTVTV